MFVFGIIEFGRAYSARIELTAAVREGARAAAVADPSAPSVAAEAATNATINGAPGLNPPLTASQVSVIACPANPGPSTNAEVTTNYPFKYDIPFVGTRKFTL